MDKTIGQIMTPARERSGFSMNECARKLNISPFHWHQIEREKRVPSEQLLKGIAQLLRIDLSSLKNAANASKKIKIENPSFEEKTVIRWMRERQKAPSDVIKLFEQTWG